MADRKKSKSNFMMQGAILGASSILVRIIGLIYRVPLNNILGEKGVAYYGVAFDVYSILLLLSSYSLPLAVSKMVSKRVTLKEYRNTKRIFIFALIFALCCGVVAFCITFFGADLFAKILHFPQSAIALRVLSPALIILSVLGVMRGYFQGLGTMIPTAVSNIVEQIINAIVSIVAATILYKSVTVAKAAAYPFDNVKEAYGAAGGTLGTVSGAFAALVFMIILFMMYRKILTQQIAKDQTDYVEPAKDILKVLVVTIIPVILSTTIYNISGLIDSGLFSNILVSRGVSEAEKDIMTGMFTGNYRLIVNVPIALASALASSLIPSVVKSVTQNNKSGVIRKVESSIKVSMIVAMPCAAGIGALSRQIIGFLFPTSVDPDKVSLMLMIGCVSVVLYSLSTITNSILQGIDKMRIPVIHSAIAIVIHVVVLVAMLYILRIDVFCLVICDMLFAFIVCFLNARSLRRYIGYKQEIKKSFLLPAICSVVMGIAAFFISKGIYKLVHSYAISVLITIVIAVIIYGVMLLLLKVLDAEEVYAMPGGAKLYALAKKLHLM
ncbi:MAG: polysaccharide biosynthesis protein [Lachnospiraceae bacterium]|nr:polysaccharide biosynthesis protein [Lachnospiraceae bacterium]